MKALLEPTVGPFSDYRIWEALAELHIHFCGLILEAYHHREK